jgi:sec-independent protein translocase protein TatB
MFGVGLPEMAVILLVAIIVFGPDKLPDYARQAGRMVRQLRRFAQSAQEDLRNELGPEYADLKLTDLDPRVAIRKHLLEAMEEDEDDLDATGRPVERPRVRDALAAGERPPFDDEST